MMNAQIASAFLFASITSLFFFVYALRIPHRLTASPTLVDEYYKNVGNIILDMFFIACYLAISLLVINLTKLPRGMATTTVTIAVTTGLLTAGFTAFFRSQPLNIQNFFSRWFHQAGYTAVVYDVLLLVCVYLIFDFMLRALS